MLPPLPLSSPPDIVGFTDISAVLPPEGVMAMLHRLYSVFDQLTIKHGLFKVEARTAFIFP